MSRELKPSEVRDFVRKHGYPPVVLKVAMDAIAIFVERRNPLEGLTLKQVDAIFLKPNTVVVMAISNVGHNWA